METNSTQQIEKPNNTLMYIFLSLSVILLGYIAYIYTTNEIINKSELKNKYVLKRDLSFDILPSYVKSKYIEVYEHAEQVNELKNEIREISLINAVPKVVEKIVEVEKIVKVPVEKIVEVEKIVTVTAPIQKENNSLSNSSSFNTYTCKSMDEGSIKISSSCIKNLHNFLDNNKNAKKFEVIGMVDNKDFKFIATLKDVYGEKKIQNLSKYSQIGLSRQRVIEASWIIKEYIGSFQNIKTVNYSVHTKDKKGFVVRAYK